MESAIQTRTIPLLISNHVIGNVSTVAVNQHFWKYCKHAACHWLVNFTLELAQVVKPKHIWRIITLDEHSTVWGGK